MYTNLEKQVMGELLNEEVAQVLHTRIKTIDFNFNYNGGHRTHGKCFTSRFSHDTNATISISKHLMHNNDIEETILHELCHAYAPFGAKHGYEWQRIASVIGSHFKVEITRTSHRERDNDNNDDIIAYLVCSHCGKKYPLRKRGKYYKNYEYYSCGSCHGKLTLEEVK